MRKLMMIALMMVGISASAQQVEEKKWGHKVKNASAEQVVNFIDALETEEIKIKGGGLKDGKVWLNVYHDEGLIEFRRTKIRTGKKLIKHLKDNLKTYRFDRDNTEVHQSGQYKGSGGSTYEVTWYWFIKSTS